VSRPLARAALAVALAVMLVASVTLALDVADNDRRIHVTAYFANTNGLYAGDEVRILGVPVGGIDSITPDPFRATVRLWFDRKYKVPADAAAVILSPALVSARVIQLTPAYTAGPTMTDNAVIPQSRTAVPVEWDDIRNQLQKLADSLQPSSPGGVAPLGAFINTAAANVRGHGVEIRDAIVKLSEALSALGDHSRDIFSTVKNLSVLVSALQSITTVLAKLNRNLAAVSGLLANDPTGIGTAVHDLDSAVRDVQGFIADNREATGTAFDKLSSLTSAINAQIPDVKQLLHVAPNSFQNFTNVYSPAQAGLTGVFTLNNFANPLQAICGAVQSASRLNYEQSAKLCMQYLAPIFKNREYNFPPLGTTSIPIPIPIPVPSPLPFLLLPIPIAVAGAAARPNELTYSEDWMRPDYNYRPGGPPPPAWSPPASPGGAPPAAPRPIQTDPAAGLRGLMVPPGNGS